MSLRVLHPVSDAIKLLGKSSLRPIAEYVEVWNAVGRIAAESVAADSDIPPSDRSVLDGYAVRWVDIAHASEDSPVPLKLAGSVEVGEKPSTALLPGQAVRVSTGSYLPAGADTVVPKEYASELGDSVLVYRAVASGYGVAVRGEDLRAGDVIVREGEVIGYGTAALLSALGRAVVRVWRPLRAALLVVGDEVWPPGVHHPPGGVSDSTGILVESWLRERGVSVEYKAYLPDDAEVIAGTVQRLIEHYDVLFTTGGTSVGRRDSTVRALHAIAEDLIHGFRLTPGRPGAVALVGGKPVIALSGMPVAAFSELTVIFDEFYRGLIGRREPWEPTLKGVMAVKYTSHAGFVNVVRSIACTADGNVTVEPLRVTGSGILSTLVKANSYFLVPEEVTGIGAGEPVEIRLLGRVPECAGRSRREG